MAKFNSHLAPLALILMPALPVLSTEPPAETAPPADVATKLAAAQDQLTAALHTDDQLQRENTQLKDTLAGQNAELEKLRQQAPASADSPDLAKQLAATEDKLSTALRSYSLLEAENDRLKSDAAKISADTQAAAAKAAAEQATRLSSLYEALRQTRAELAALAAENADLRTRLSLAAPAPGGAITPTRPGRAPVANPTARTHLVVAGDTLAGISRRYYGTPDRAADILRANRDIIGELHALPPGVTLRLP